MAEIRQDFDGTPIVSLGDAGAGATSALTEIGGLKIRAFYDSAHRLLFVMDLTRDDILPNALLVLDARDNRKWNDILQNDFGINPETVRPRKNNRYQKLDIEYGGLDIYARTIAGGDADELKKWRIEAAGNQRDIRITEAEHDLGLARATVDEASKTIAGLDEFVTLQTEKLKLAKKEMGSVPPKESAAKILRYESRIEHAQAKLARARRRLRRAEKRIDSDLEMLDNYKTKVSKGEYMAENDVRPLFTEDPKIMDTANAFKPVSFSDPQSAAPAAMMPPMPVYAPATVPYSANEVNRGSEGGGYFPQPAAQNFAPATPAPQPIARPNSPYSGEQKVIESHSRGQGGGYYLLLMLLIGLSIYTLYLYQQKLGSDNLPHIAATTEPTALPVEAVTEATVAPPPAIAPQPIVEHAAPAENPFIEETATQSDPQIASEPEQSSQSEPESIQEPEPAEFLPPEPKPTPEPISESEILPQPEPLTEPEIPINEPESLEYAPEDEIPAGDVPLPDQQDVPLEYEQNDGVFQDYPEPTTDTIEE